MHGPLNIKNHYWYLYWTWTVISVTIGFEFLCVTLMNFSFRGFKRCRVLKESFLFYKWVISKVLQTVYFLFKNEFVLQNTFTGLQCNLHFALLQRSNVWESLVFLSGRLRC
jgi:hypothetical protein